MFDKDENGTTVLVRPNAGPNSKCLNYNNKKKSKAKKMKGKNKVFIIKMNI